MNPDLCSVMVLVLGRVVILVVTVLTPVVLFLVSAVCIQFPTVLLCLVIAAAMLHNRWQVVVVLLQCPLLKATLESPLSIAIAHRPAFRLVSAARALTVLLCRLEWRQ